MRQYIGSVQCAHQEGSKLLQDQPLETSKLAAKPVGKEASRARRKVGMQGAVKILSTSTNVLVIILKQLSCGTSRILPRMRFQLLTSVEVGCCL